MSENSNVIKTNRKFLYPAVAISGVILVVVIVLALLGVFSQDNRTDQEKLVDAAILTMLSEGKDVEVTIGIEDLKVEGMEGPQAQVLERVIKDLSIDLNLEENGEALQLSFSLGMSGISIVDGVLYADSDLMAISVPSLYDKVVYLYTEDMANLMNGHMDMPSMTDQQKEAHEAVFEEIKAYLLDRDYEAIEQMDFVGYYTVLTTFIESIMTEEVSLVEEDDESFIHYQMAADFTKLISLFPDLKEVYDVDEAIKELVESHQAAIPMNEGEFEMDDFSFALDESFNGLDEITMTSEVFVDQDGFIESSSLLVALPIEEGIPGLIEYPLDLVIACESEIEIVQDDLVIEVMDLSDGVDIGAMSNDELEVFKAELMASIEKNLSENQLFQMMGIDPSLLFGE